MTQPRTAPSTGEHLEYDICIVGAGAAGLTLALDLIDSGQRVAVIEAGALNGKPTDQSLYEGEVVGTRHAQPHMYRHRRLGGSTAIWGGRCIPYDPVDFERRDYVAMSGWPIAPQEVVRHYPRAQEILEAGAYDYAACSAIADGDLIAGFRDPDVLTESLERFSLPTNFWREHGAAINASPNVQLVAEASALKLRRGDGERIEALVCAGPGGGQFEVRARQFILAVGGLETVRLLGFSGLGDEGGMLGRTYMCHVESSLGELRLSPKDRAIKYGFERTRDGVYARRRFTLSAERQRELRVMNVAIRPHHPAAGDPSHGHPVLSAMFLAKRFIIPEYARRFAALEKASGKPHGLDLLGAHLKNVVLGSPRLALFTADWTYRRYLSRRRLPYVALPSAAGAFPLDLNAEQEPNLESRVSLTDQLDRNGMPRLRVDWRLTELDYRTVSTALRELRGALRRTDCGDVAFDDAALDEEVRENVKPVGGHHIGTARMSLSPADGVVDTDCRVHGTANLYVASAATFPTSSHANPTLTIVAMALRLGEHLRAQRDNALRAA
ncbi:MAG: GMC family oxidoreductase [Phenylobacterium zucineum]|nr:MAG: GMC family oxidoreductase [Phenylobacterium zucineum]